MGETKVVQASCLAASLTSTSMKNLWTFCFVLSIRHGAPPLNKAGLALLLFAIRSLWFITGSLGTDLPVQIKASVNTDYQNPASTWDRGREIKNACSHCGWCSHTAALMRFAFLIVLIIRLWQCTNVNSDDTVHHKILLNRWNYLVGISGSALAWFSSFLAHWSFSVCVGEFFLATASLTCGVPQGSVLGPMLLSLYMLP